MKNSFWKILVMHCMKLLELLVTIALFCLFWNVFYVKNLTIQPDPVSYLFMPMAYAVIVILMVRIYNAFDTGMTKVSEVIYSLTLSDIVAVGIFYVMSVVALFKLMNPLPVLGLLMVQLIWNIVWAILANKLYFAIHAPKKTAVIYHSDEDLEKLEEMRYFENKFDVQKKIHQPNDIDEVIKEVKDYQVVFISGIEATLRNDILKYCVENRIQVYMVPHVGDILLAGGRHMKMVSVPVMRVRRKEPHPEFLMIKRAFDILVSLLAIIITSPLMLITAIIIKAYDRGPVFYKQVRLTKDGRIFHIIKFRSMRVDAESDGVARLASTNDDRVTPVGKVIRAIRFDELPQLFNILNGSMTIVGPRPERPEIAKQYEEKMPEFALRLQVKAGLTGYAQIYGRYNTEPNDKLKMDLMYINNMSIAEDLRLMFATVKILFMKESTEGVTEGSTTAMSSE